MHEPTLPLTQNGRVHNSPSHIRGHGLHDSMLQASIDIKTRQQIIFSLWDLDISNQPGQSSSCQMEQFNAFFFYYTRQCVTALHDNGRFVALRKHQDILDIAAILKKDITRDEVKTQLLNVQYQNNERINGSIDLVVRLLLMMEIGHVPNSFSGYRDILWETGSLREFVASHFPPIAAVEDRSNKRVKLEKVFIARNFGRIAGIKIVWTDNLVDHLRLLECDNKVAVFHHASFLETLRNSDLFPNGFVEETLRTLALLFPQSDNNSKKWFMKVASAQSLDFKANQYGQLRAEARQIDEFKFWRRRIVLLKQVFDEAEPTTWRQWWYDRRRSVHRYPLMIAAAALMLNLLLGLTQCGLGALQVYAAYESRNQICKQ